MPLASVEKPAISTKSSNPASQIWYQNDYQLYDIAYASRRSQQKQNARMAILNNRAKRDKVPLTDISEILTFVAC